MIPASAPANPGKQLFETANRFVKTPLVEQGGFPHVPQQPGIGVKVDKEGCDADGRRLQGGRQ